MPSTPSLGSTFYAASNNPLTFALDPKSNSIDTITPHTPLQGRITDLKSIIEFAQSNHLIQNLPLEDTAKNALHHAEILEQKAAQRNTNIEKNSLIQFLHIVLLILTLGIYHYIDKLKIPNTSLLSEEQREWLQLPPRMEPQWEEGPENEIKAGYGEYVVYRQSDSGIEPVSSDTYNRVYEIFEKFRLGNILQCAEKPNELSRLCENRLTLIDQKIKEIDPALHMRFIPRTLYDLYLADRVIFEEIQRKESRDYNGEPNVRYHFLSKEDISEQADLSTPEQEKLRNIAYNLNIAIVNSLKTEDIQPTLESLQQAAVKKSKRLKYDPSKPYIDHQNKFQEIDNFADLFRKTIELECRPEAKNAYILYRGGDPTVDSPINAKRQSHRLSFGSSLLAGAMHESTSGCVLSFLTRRYDRQKGYAIILSAEEIFNRAKNYFHLHNTNAVFQFFAKGEKFHPSTLIPNELEKDENLQYNIEDFSWLTTDLSLNDLQKGISSYLESRIDLPIPEISGST